MTHQQLHTLSLDTDKKKALTFSDLASDPRMAGLINALRRGQPLSSGGDAHHVIRDGGRGEGWKLCIDEIEKFLSPPRPDSDPGRLPPYAPENRGGFNSNNPPA